MKNISAILFAVIVLGFCASTAEARGRISIRSSGGYSTGSSSYTPRGYYGSTSSSSSSGEDRDSGWSNVYLILLVLILFGFVIRILAGIIGFLAWLVSPTSPYSDD